MYNCDSLALWLSGRYPLALPVFLGAIYPGGCPLFFLGAGVGFGISSTTAACRSFAVDILDVVGHSSSSEMTNTMGSWSVVIG